MTNLDRDVRATMAHRASFAPSADGLMDAVLRRRRRQRRRQVIAGVLSLVLLAGAGAAFVFRPQEDQTLQITDGRTDWPGPAPIGVGWLPSGFGEEKVLYLRPGVWGIGARRGEPVAAWLSVQVMSREPEIRKGTGEVRTVDVNGTDATLYWSPEGEAASAGPELGNPFGPFGELTYQRKPGQWVKVAATVDTNGPLGVTGDDLVKVAENLTDEQQPVVDVIRMTLPPGTEVGRAVSGPAMLMLVPAGAPSEPVSLAEWPGTYNTESAPAGVRLTVDITRADDPNLTELRNTAETRPGKRSYEELIGPVAVPPEGLTYRSGSTLWYLHQLSGHAGWLIALRVDASDPLASTERLRAIAETVRPGPDARLGP
ncbi:hypothetical protein [Cryptosporangium sp. NPDC048952]|uniref:hypothetical protein n=1 Tax=Cryptosporangium sp. NPDC048952 TaxID=3363961 RepID=UPI0037118279